MLFSAISSAGLGARLDATELREMRVNAHCAVLGTKVALVPYREEHVKTYHEWMSRPELLQLTASEPLTLEQEYEMQRKWREDDDKLTFIVLARDPHEPAPSSPTEIASLPMVGDVNIFFNQPDEAEVEIMIAETAYRRQGLAKCALELLLSYVTAAPLSVPVSNLVVKIGKDNAPSIALFRRLHFDVVSGPNVFGEVELRYTKAAPDGEWEQGTTIVYP